MPQSLTLFEAASKFLEQARTTDSLPQYNAKAQAIRSLLNVLQTESHLNPLRTNVAHLSLIHIASYKSNLQQTRSIETEHLYTRSIISFLQHTQQQLTQHQQSTIQTLIAHLQEHKRLRPHTIQQVPVDAINTILTNAHSLDITDDTEPNSRLHLQALRDRAIVFLLADTGIRPAELCDLRISNILQHAISVDTAELLIKPHTNAYLRNYLSARQSTNLKGAHAHPVFSRHDKRASRRLLPISRWTLANIITAMAERYLPPTVKQQLNAQNISISPISFRHYFVIATFMETNNLLATSQRARHKDAATTRQYLPQTIPQASGE